MPTTIRLMDAPEPLELRRPPECANFFVLSPYVSRSHDGYTMLVRLVNREEDASKKISRIHAATSSEGRTFTIGVMPVIEPGPSGSDDDGGCEDPTVARNDGHAVVFYSGYGGPRKRSTMLIAIATEGAAMRKRGLAFDDPAFENPKEAALIATPDGFRMFFEFATDGASRIGSAHAASLRGPWQLEPSFLLERPGHFDAWHLSPASAVRLEDGSHVLLYNGSTKETKWRIGWARLSNDTRTLLDRCDEPIIGTSDLEPGDSDIAFAASTIVEKGGEVWLYYSTSDRRLLRQRLYVEGAVSDSAVVQTA